MVKAASSTNRYVRWYLASNLSLRDPEDAACEAWRTLVSQPNTITSIGIRTWAHGY